MEINNKKQIYERIGTLPLDEVFYHIQENFNNPGKKGKVYIRGFYVNVQSLRLRTFHNTGVQCPCCDNQATFFAVERGLGNEKVGFHLNLYGFDKDKNEILFTHDHILARSLGGSDTLDNTETMCGTCNWNKGKLEQKKGNLLRNVETSPEYLIEMELINKELEKYHHNKTVRKMKR